MKEVRLLVAVTMLLASGLARAQDPKDVAPPGAGAPFNAPGAPSPPPAAVAAPPAGVPAPSTAPGGAPVAPHNGAVPAPAAAVPPPNAAVPPPNVPPPSNAGAPTTATAPPPGATAPPGGAGAPPPPGGATAGGAPAPEADAERPLGDEEAMVLNFERADIREVIHSLATALGLSYTLDPRIEGQVTIRTTGRIARDDLFPLFNQILRQNGVAAVQTGDLWQILPVAEAKTRAIIPMTPGARKTAGAQDDFVIEILQLKHVVAEEMQNILQPFLTPGGDILSYPRANTLVVTDLQSNVQRLRELAATFDVDGFGNLHARVFKMKDADPEELANELLTLLTPYGITATGEGEGGVFMVPLSRLNALVVFAIDKAAFPEIERWITFLDIPPDQGAGRQTFVYSVENAKAADLADVLNELFGGGGQGGPGGLGRAPGAAPAGIGLFGASGSNTGGAGGGRFGGAGSSSSRRGNFGGGAAGGGVSSFGNAAGGVGTALGGGAGSMGGGGATSLGGGGTGRTGSRRGGLGGAGGAPGQPGSTGGVAGVSLPGGPGSTAGGGAGGVGGLPTSPGPPPVFREEVRIVADEVTNSLIVLATKRDYQLILDVVRKIDVIPRQVVLECMIVEVQLKNDLQFGIEYALSSGWLTRAFPGSDGKTADVFTNRHGGQNRGADSLGGFLNDLTQRVPSNGAFAVITDRQNFQIFINALAGQTDVKMLSAPHIIAADNREAHILVGESVPILTSTASNVLTSGTNATVNSIQYRDTGKILTVLPQVNSKGLVNMQIRQEVSAVAASAFGNTNSPSFTTREAETTVVVQDSETVLIGGIIDDSISKSHTGIPFLMDIPVLGPLFRTDVDSRARTELLITITPSVIRNREEAREVTDDYTDRIRGLARMRRALQTRRMRERSNGPRTLEFPAGTPLHVPDAPAAEPSTSGVVTPPELR